MTTDHHPSETTGPLPPVMTDPSGTSDPLPLVMTDPSGTNDLLPPVMTDRHLSETSDPLPPGMTVPPPPGLTDRTDHATHPPLAARIPPLMTATRARRRFLPPPTGGVALTPTHVIHLPHHRRKRSNPNWRRRSCLQGVGVVAVVAGTVRTGPVPAVMGRSLRREGGEAKPRWRRWMTSLVDLAEGGPRAVTRKRQFKNFDRSWHHLALVTEGFIVTFIK